MRVGTNEEEAPTLRDRLEGALWGIFIGDALSMPVHWYYDPQDIVRDYGGIRGYEAPREKHPSSIMDRSATGHGGRGSAEGDVVGAVILHGKKHLWGGPRGVHYHQGMKAGENTLNALCARLVLRSVAASGGYAPADFLERYVRFMTTPGSHDDTYCESFHRDFFRNWAKGRPPERCCGEPDSETPQIGGLVMPIAVAVACAGLGRAVAERHALTHLRLTHRSDKLEAHLRRWLDVLFEVLAGAPLREAARRAARALGPDPEALLARGVSDEAVAHETFGPACYIEDALPTLLHLAYRHAGSLEAALLANANVGGENCHRGSALGALLGAANGARAIAAPWTQGLRAGAEIEGEIRAALDAGSGVAGVPS